MNVQQRPRVLLAGSDLVMLVELAHELGPTDVDEVLVHNPRPVQRLLSHPDTSAQAAVIFLSGDDAAGELEPLFLAHPSTRFLVLPDSGPPCPDVSDLVSRYGGAVLASDELKVLIAATVIALLAETPQRIGVDDTQRDFASG